MTKTNKMLLIILLVVVCGIAIAMNIFAILKVIGIAALIAAIILLLKGKKA